MRKTILILALIFSCLLTGFSQEVGKNAIDANGQRQGYWIITGIMQKDRSYANEAKVEEGNYKDSQKTGVWKSYYPTGKNKNEFTYVNNRPNGHAITYNENGTKAEEGTWVGTRWVGDYHLYYEDGTERQAFNYNQVGQRDGKQVYKNPNGTLACEVTVVAGKEEGWKKEYDANGNLVKETYFNGGVIDDSKTVVHATTTAVVKAPDDPSLTKEKPPVAKAEEKPPSGTFSGNGPYTLYYNGQITKKGTFSAFKLVDGESRIYDNNGMLIQIKLYKGGQYVGDSPIPADANK